ncbi:MAG TPA: hypothetical protein VE954_28885 [Oligoflexus sp.]|uniref:hypothetical protein n=1 Tax=Oligoflexus sp. TaxID=1971216 RepID=UPI002D5C60FE|nr:hypothetical protein [Oligoflexus sp.]HYX37137.1 hypothetical protein [Oligoflexus sp.]
MTIHKNTEESLGIFWRGDEVDGITLYAYGPGAELEDPSQALADLGLQDFTFKQATKLSGDSWTVHVLDVKVSRWPSAAQWPATIQRLLRALLGTKAQVAWAGLDEIFAEPPSLFDPEKMQGGVWAALLANGHFSLAAQLGQPMVTLPREEMLTIQKYLGF